jgi:hypothetical protein
MHDQNFKNLILEKQRKYADFIDFYADLNEDEVSVYRMRYLVGKGEETILIISDFGEADFFARFLFWVATGRFATC